MFPKNERGEGSAKNTNQHGGETTHRTPLPRVNKRERSAWITLLHQYLVFLRGCIPNFNFFFFLAGFNATCSLGQTSAIRRKGYHIAHNIIYLCIKSGPVSQIHKKDWTLFFCFRAISYQFSNGYYTHYFRFGFSLLWLPSPPYPNVSCSGFYIFELDATFSVGKTFCFRYQNKQNIFFSVRIVDKTFSFQIRMEKGCLLNVCVHQRTNKTTRTITTKKKKKREENNRKKNINR